MSDQNMSSNNNSMDTDDTNAEENQNAKHCSDDMQTCSSGSSSQSKRFVVKKLETKALWAWDVLVDRCGFCRNEIMDVCIDCEANPMCCTTKEECTVAWGTCNHVFHFHCISRWLKILRICRLDNKEWDWQKYGQ